MGDGIFFEGDAIVDIPNEDSYDEVISFLVSIGFRGGYAAARKHFKRYPYIVVDKDGDVCGCNDYCSDIKRKIPYVEFLNMRQPSNPNWREHLSDQFNQKINSYDKSRMDSQG